MNTRSVSSLTSGCALNVPRGPSLARAAAVKSEGIRNVPHEHVYCFFSTSTVLQNTFHSLFYKGSFNIQVYSLLLLERQLKRVRSLYCETPRTQHCCSRTLEPSGTSSTVSVNVRLAALLTLGSMWWCVPESFQPSLRTRRCCRDSGVLGMPPTPRRTVRGHRSRTLPGKQNNRTKKKRE